MTAQGHEPEFACRLDAIPQAQRAQHEEETQRLFAAVRAVLELPTGYALRLANERDMLQHIAAFIDNERLCCPFLHFELEVASEQGLIWLRITGTDDVKPFLLSQSFFPSHTD